MKSIKKGFTLIELLIVIAIISVLAIAFLPQVLGAPSKGRDAQRLAQIQKLQQFLTAESVAGTSLPDSGCITGSADGTIGGLINSNLPDFGGIYPSDPQTDGATTGSSPACTSGNYGYVEFTYNDAAYSAGVFSKMENKENANILCEDIDNNADATVIGKLGSDDDPTGSNEYCYMALIQ